MSAQKQDYDYESILSLAAPAAAADMRAARVPPPKSRSLSANPTRTAPPIAATPTPANAAADATNNDAVVSSEDFCASVTAHLDACGLSGVHVSMNRGLLTLTGTVASQYEKSLAIDYVRRYAKVSGVSDQLRVASQNKRENVFERAAGLGIDFGQACIDWFSATPRSARYLIAACLVVAVASWWRPASGDPHIAVYPVSGNVLVDGEVPAGAQIVLHPQGHTLPEGIAATATVHEDGSFSVSIYGDEPGVPPGDYVATVHWFRSLGSESQGKRGVADFVAMTTGSQHSAPVVPTIYTSPNSSPLRVTVREDQNELGPIVITRQ